MEKIDSVIELLLRRGADLNHACRVPRLPGQEGMPGSALHICAIEACEYLALPMLDYGADVNLRNHWGITSLHLAVVVPRCEMVKLFIRRGADTFPRDIKRETAAGYKLDTLESRSRKEYHRFTVRYIRCRDKGA